MASPLFWRAALSAARSCSSTPICASACYIYANNPPLAFLLPVFLEVEAMASVVCSIAYRSAIYSMLAFRVFVIKEGVRKGKGDTE